MKHVKPALDYAIDTITIEEDFLENYKFELEYGNSQCSKDAKLIASDMYYGSLQKGNLKKNWKISKLTPLPLTRKKLLMRHQFELNFQLDNTVRYRSRSYLKYP